MLFVKTVDFTAYNGSYPQTSRDIFDSYPPTLFVDGQLYEVGAVSRGRLPTR